jgi:lipid-A-disaccharide synthase
MVVGYKLNPVTYAILKAIIRTPHATLFNIAADRFVAPEMIQARCNGPDLARELALRLDDPAARERQKREQFEALDRMGRGGPDPSEAAADAVLNVLGEGSLSPALP